VQFANGAYGPWSESWSPNVALAPGASFPFHDAFVTVSTDPLWVVLPFQLFVTALPDGRLNTSVQPFTVVDPVFEIVKFPVYPPFQILDVAKTAFRGELAAALEEVIEEIGPMAANAAIKLSDVIQRIMEPVRCFIVHAPFFFSPDMRNGQTLRGPFRKKGSGLDFLIVCSVSRFGNTLLLVSTNRFSSHLLEVQVISRLLEQVAHKINNCRPDKNTQEDSSNTDTRPKKKKECVFQNN